MWRIRVLWSLAIAILPSFLKIPLYRLLYGYQIGKGVRIGLSPFIGVANCKIGDYTRVGHFNIFFRIDSLDIGSHSQIGFLNVFRGGRQICIGSYSSILRLNTFNAIIDGDFLEPVEATLDLGVGVVITSGHWLDFSKRITIGSHTIIGGRNSSFWTHNRQRSRPIQIGHHCYLGSEIRLAPGVEVAPLCIVALGSVLAGSFSPPQSLIGGNPAIVIRSLREQDLYLVCRKTRKDIPDELVQVDLPKELWEGVARPSSNNSADRPEENSAR